MSDADESQKTEEPTGQRLQKARQDGNVANSKELTTWFFLFGTAILVIFIAPYLVSALKKVLLIFLLQPQNISFEPRELGLFLQRRLLDVLLILAAPFTIFLVIAFVSNFVQIGWLWTFKPLQPKFSKLNPISGLKRQFSLKQFVEFAKGIFKMVLVGSVGVILLKPEFARLDTLPSSDMTAMVDEIFKIISRLLIAVVALLFVVTILDVIYQRFDHRKKLRMTKQEVKEEFKNTEGDPKIKGKMRQLRMQRAQQRMMQAVPKADVVVTNPTHFAVALAYDPDGMGAPTLVAKGQDLIARKIREVAEENDVPIVENPPLARALYASVELDDEVPEEHYVAVAKVISYVFGLKGRRLPE